MNANLIGSSGAAWLLNILKSSLPRFLSLIDNGIISKPLVWNGRALLSILVPSKYWQMRTIAALALLLNNSVWAQGMVIDAARISPDQLVDPNVTVAVVMFDPLQKLSYQDAAKALKESGQVALHFQPIYCSDQTQSAPTAINLILSADQVDKNSNLLGLYLLSPRVPVLLILKKHDQGYALMNSGSWAIWMADTNKNLTPEELIRSGLMGGTSFDRAKLDEILDVAIKASSAKPDEMRGVKSTFLQLAQFQHDTLSNMFHVDNIASLLKRVRESLVEKPNLIPIEIIPLINEPSEKGFSLLVALLEDPSISSEAKKTCENPLQKIAGKMNPTVLSKSFSTIKSQTSPDVQETFLLLLSKNPSVLPVDVYAEIALESKESLPVRFAALRCLYSLKIPKSPPLPSRSSFIKNPSDTLKEWSDFLSTNL